jgi:glycosyltransferase involved in cell wall biosynthesis
MTERRVLLISMVFHPDEVAVANLFTNLSVELAASGLEIEVWCAQPSYTNNRRQPHELFYKGLQIKYLRSTTFHKDRLAGRIANFVTFSIIVVFRLLFSKSRTRVVSNTTPPFLAIIISLLCSLKKRKFVYVLMDIFPDGLIRLGKVSEKNIFIKIWQAMHRAALKRSEYIVVIGRDMRDWITDFFPLATEKTKYIPLWQDKELITPVDIKLNPYIEKYQLQGNFIVQYSGNMGLWNDMTAIGNAINSNPDGVKFLMIGGGMRKKELLEALDRPEMANAIFLPFQENNDYAYSVTACHAAIVSLRGGLEGIAVPSKIIGIIAAGIPVIAMVPAKSEIAYIVQEEQCGLVIDPSDTVALIDAINKLKSDDAMRLKMGRNGREAFLKKYTAEIVSKKYFELLTN